MPRWPDELFDCTIFLYESVEDAEAGESTGGCGFLVGIPWESNPEKKHVYAVSNYHVAVSGGASVIRLNTKDGKSEPIDTDPLEWFFNRGRDLAVYRIDGSKHFRQDSIFDFKFEDFSEVQLTKALWDKYHLGIGDDVVSFGCFIDLEGIQRNEPVLRTGVLASGKILPVGRDDNVPWEKEPSFIVEMRSRTGFSGSPVYIYIDWATSRMVDIDYNDDKTAYEMFKGPWLLGVHWGQFPITGPDANDASIPSFMLAVVPCYALTELLLENDKVIQERREYEEMWKDVPKVIAESEPSTKADNPSHKEDFNRLLASVAPEKQSGDQT